MHLHVVAGVVLSSALAASASSSPLTESLTRGLQVVIERQSENEAGWAWNGEPQRRHLNLGGVIANALLDTYDAHPDFATWVTLHQYALHISEHYRRRSEELPFKADIELLARLAQQERLPEGSLTAGELFERVRRRSPTGADEVARITRGRADVPDILGYDIALAIRAALSVGAFAYADELGASALAAKVGELRGAAPAVLVTSCGAMVDAYARLGGRYTREAQRLAQQLIAQQNPAGSWADNDTQATAYALKGLASIGNAAYQRALQRGTGWLVRTQLGDGRWAAYHDGWSHLFVGEWLPLVQAETLTALLASEHADRDSNRRVH